MANTLSDRKSPEAIALADCLANLDFEGAKALIHKITFDFKGTDQEGYMAGITSATKAYIELAFGRFSEFDGSIQSALASSSKYNSLTNDDLMSLYKISAIRYFMVEDSSNLDAVAKKASELASTSKSTHSFLMVTSIEAMNLFIAGEYRKAHELASTAYRKSIKNNYAGLFGHLDSLFVIARCELEFSKVSEANKKFEQVKETAASWRLWSWHFLADGYLSRDLALKGSLTEALASIKNARERAFEVDVHKTLDSIIDWSEAYIRMWSDNSDRVKTLIERDPDLWFNRNLKIIEKIRSGDKSVIDDIQLVLPLNPRLAIWRYVMEAGLVLDQETLAIEALEKALKIGEQVGSRESLLRNSTTVGRLIIKIASLRPTAYLEDLSLEISQRIESGFWELEETLGSLTKREKEILYHLNTGQPRCEMATNLGISVNTLKTHLKNLYRKLDVTSREEAIDKAKAQLIL